MNPHILYQLRESAHSQLEHHVQKTVRIFSDHGVNAEEKYSIVA